MQFARSVFCARLPMTAPMLDEVTAFLNDKNRETGEADYNWSVLADKCVHTQGNALAAANVWSPMSVRTVKLLHLVNLAVPAYIEAQRDAVDTMLKRLAAPGQTDGR